MLEDQTYLDIHDLGAGSQVLKSSRRKVSQIARSSGISPKKGKLLFRLVNHFQPQLIIELGTSLGLSALYMGSALKTNQLYSFEGCPQLANRARQGFASLGLNNIEIREGDISEKLPELLKEIPGIDFAYLDANHQYQPSIDYFELLLGQVQTQTVLVMDDIYWSAGMQKAWKHIIAHPQVSLSLDLFEIGLLFFMPRKQKEHFQLRF